jgi:hypothetical protein
MVGESKDRSYDDWVKYIFDHPLADPPWYFHADAEWWNGPADPALTVSYLTRLFETSSESLNLFSDEQINQGFWFLVDSGGSGHFLTLFDPQVPPSERIRCVESIFSLNRDLFAPRCSPLLGHIMTQEEYDANPLNSICYMWWDIAPLYGKSGEPAREALDDAALSVMEKCLSLSAPACQEGALHGLGHWQSAYPERVTAAIDAYLESSPSISPDLQAYARNARRGHVL